MATLSGMFLQPCVNVWMHSDIAVCTHFHKTEMLLLCNEANLRRSRTLSMQELQEAGRPQSKPLALEYIADRF